MIAQIKEKWRTPFTSPRHSYRSRTGPLCCSANCGRQRQTINGGVKRHKGGLKLVSVKKGAAA